MARGGRINSRDIRRMAQKIQKEFDKHPISIPLRADTPAGEDLVAEPGSAEPVWDSWVEGFDARTDVRTVRLLVWLYENGGSIGFTSIADFLKEHDIESDAGYVLNDHLESAGEVTDANALGGPPVLKLTSYGVSHAEEILQRRSDRARRISDVRRQMLRWLFDQTERDQQPQSWSDFVELGPTHLAGDSFSESEVGRQSRFLDEVGLIEATTVKIEEEAPGWFAPRITSRGQECVLGYEGAVERYMDRDSTGNKYYGPVIHGNVNDSQMAWGNQTVSQSGGQHDQVVAPGYEEIATVVSGIVADAAKFGLDDDGKGDIEAVGQDILTEVGTSEPDRGKVRRWVATLKGILTPLAIQASTGAGEGIHELAQQAVTALGDASF